MGRLWWADESVGILHLSDGPLHRGANEDLVTAVIRTRQPDESDRLRETDTSDTRRDLTNPRGWVRGVVMLMNSVRDVVPIMWRV